METTTIEVYTFAIREKRAVTIYFSILPTKK